MMQKAILVQREIQAVQQLHQAALLLKYQNTLMALYGALLVSMHTLLTRQQAGITVTLTNHRKTLATTSTAGNMYRQAEAKLLLQILK